MAEFMKAIAVIKPDEVKVVHDVPVPEPGDYEALVKVHACAFCNGTDMQVIHGTIQHDFLGYPTILGHEGAGEVIKVGSKVRNIKVGDRYIHNNLHDNVGNGYSRTYGGFAQYGIVSDNAAMLEDGYSKKDFPFVKQHKFPADIDYTDATLLLSLAECCSAAKNFGVCEGKDVIIYGDGPMGIATSFFCKLFGANVTHVGMLADRLAAVKKIAAPDLIINAKEQNTDEVLNGKLFDIAIDIVGNTKIMYEANHRLKLRGTVGLMGVYKPDDYLIDISKLKVNTSVQYLNFPSGEYEAINDVIQLIEDGRLNPKDFYSHVLPMEQIDTALELVRTYQSLKVVLTID